MDEKPFDTLNVIPFVDIMLVLLTIVLTTSSFIASGRIPIKVPQASQSVSEADKAMVIEMGLGGEIYLNNKAVTMTSLHDNLAPIGRETNFIIRADSNIPLQRFIDVADVLNQMSFHRVAVQTKKRT